MKRNAFAAFCLLVGGLAGASTLVQITTADGAGADVYVENNKANFGDAPLVVKNAARGVDDPHVTRKVYLRFDLSDFTDRLSDLENAELSLMTHTNHLGGSATPPRAYEVSVVGLTNEIVTHTGFVENKGRWSEAEIAAYQQTPAAVYEGKSVRFIAILRAHEPFTSPPNYTHTIVGETGDITVTLSDGTVDVITITADNMSFQRTAP